MEEVYYTNIIIGITSLCTIVNINERKCCFASINSPSAAPKHEIRRKHNSYGKIRGSTRGLLQPTRALRNKEGVLFPERSRTLLISNTRRNLLSLDTRFAPHRVHLSIPRPFSLPSFSIFVPHAFVVERRREFHGAANGWLPLIIEECETDARRNRCYSETNLKLAFITRGKMLATISRYHTRWLINLMNVLCRSALFRALTRYISLVTVFIILPCAAFSLLSSFWSSFSFWTEASSRASCDFSRDWVRFEVSRNNFRSFIIASELKRFEKPST